MKVSVYFPQLDLGFGSEFAAVADRLGFHRVWVSEAYGHDAFSVIAALASRTKQIGLATGIVNVFSRSAPAIGQAAATVDALSGGRFTLGLGSSGPGVVAGWHGLPYERPVARIRDYVSVIRTVLRREKLRFEGDALSIQGGLRLMCEPVRTEIPIYLGAISPRGIELAGEIADGWLPIHFSPSHFDSVLRPALDTGLARSGRGRQDVRVAAYHVPLVITDDVEAGLDADRARVALYVGGMGTQEKNFYRDLYGRYGYSLEAAEIQRLYLRGEREAAVAAVPDRMVAEGAIVGTVEDCRRRLVEFADSGVDEVVLSIVPVAGDSQKALASLEALANAIGNPVEVQPSVGRPALERTTA